MKPRDTLQEYAARELVARNWRYHKGIQVWLTKDSNVEPVLINPDVEKVSTFSLILTTGKR